MSFQHTVWERHHESSQLSAVMMNDKTPDVRDLGFHEAVLKSRDLGCRKEWTILMTSHESLSTLSWACPFWNNKVPLWKLLLQKISLVGNRSAFSLCKIGLSSCNITHLWGCCSTEKSGPLLHAPVGSCWHPGTVIVGPLWWPVVLDPQ